MSWGALSDQSWTGDAGTSSATSTAVTPGASAKETFTSEALASGLLLVEVGPPRAAVRGRLGLLLEGAIERALESRGAPPPAASRPSASGPSAMDGRDASLDDLLRRAHVSGAVGLAVWVSSLAAIASAGALDSEDSGTIRWWLSATAERPVRLGFDPANHALGVYLAPVTLESILAEAARVGAIADDDGESERDDDIESESAAPSSSPSSSSSSSDDETSATDAEETSSVDAAPGALDDEEAPISAPESSFADSARAMADTLTNAGDTGWLRDALLELSTPPPRPVAACADDETSETTETARAVLRDACVPPLPVAPRFDLRFAEEASPPEPEPEPVRYELDADARRHLEACARELRAAGGPKPLAVVERLFVNAYVPLRAALDRGADAPVLAEVADEWARNFEKSYVDAFDALRVRAKRPTMVVDVPDITLRVARLHGARATQLLLVDGLRYELGDRVNERLRAIVGQRAACADRFLLWAALPTTTAAQLELIGRGAAGLREFTGEVSEDLVVARGRKASMIRRLKTGHREVLKLDIVEARLAEPGGAEPAGFDAMADEVAERIAAHFEGLQPRTLVMVFGDHGFAMNPVNAMGDGPRTARSGGGSPEEVLVPASAWLVGAVH